MNTVVDQDLRYQVGKTDANMYLENKTNRIKLLCRTPRKKAGKVPKTLKITPRIPNDSSDPVFTIRYLYTNV